jgi:hypothetical protein
MSAANLLAGGVAIPQPKLADLGAWSGVSAAMAAGSVAIVIPFLPTSAGVLATPIGAGAGVLSTGVANAGAANATLTITSSNGADVRQVAYLCFATA